jgi:type II secretory pathway pseudopilin PulG
VTEEQAVTRPERLRHIGRDVVLIVLGAVLAYVGEEWRDARHKRDRVETALHSIRDELKANAALVSEARTKHLFMVDTLGKLVKSHKRPPVPVYSNGMWSPADVTDIAWQAARETGTLAELPLNTVLAVAPVYAAQDRYRAATDAVSASIMNDLRRSSVEDVTRDHFAQFIPLDIDFSNRERVLLSDYKAALAKLASIR